MRVAHVGPPLMRMGGPAGYLLELSRAAESSPEEGRHDVRFPAISAQSPPKPKPSRLRQKLRRARRALLGAPRFHRPSPSEMKREGGPVAELVANAAKESAELCRPSLSGDADVFFLHDVFAVEPARLAKGGAEIWLMIHSPMPLGLYLAWNWGVPEASWEEIAALPDVKNAIDRELSLLDRVDRIIVPCVEALEELARVDTRFAEIDRPIHYVLTGSSAVGQAGESASSRDEPCGLFLGSNQPYRGLPVLLEALELLPDGRELPGTVAIAGPDPEAIRSHPRVRKLGRVDDVPAVLASVDFLVNTNRFSLFDLSNIEAVAAGKPLLLHSVGGNKTLARLGAGCRTFEPLTPEVLARALEGMFSESRETLLELGRKSRQCYERHLTREAMWRRHLDLYDHAGVRIAV